MCTEMRRGDGDIFKTRMTAFFLTASFLFSAFIIPGDARVSGSDEMKDWPPLWTLRGPLDLEEVPDFFPYLSEDRDTPYHIVQFDHPVGDDDKRMMEGVGLTRLDYIPDNAFIVMDPNGVIDTLGDESVRHIPLPSFMKISSTLLSIVVGASF